MKKISYFIVLVLLVFVSKTSLSQEKSENEDVEYKHHIGINGGYATGYGLSYLYQTDKYGFKFTYSPFYNKNLKFTSIAITCLYKINQGKRINFMLYLSNCTNYSTNKFDYEEYNKIDHNILNATGFGLVYQIKLSTHYQLSFTTGYAFSYNKNEHLDGDSKSIMFFPDAAISLYFMF